MELSRLVCRLSSVNPRLIDDKRSEIWETFFDKMIEDTKSDTKKGGRKRRIKVSRLEGISPLTRGGKDGEVEWPRNPQCLPNCCCPRRIWRPTWEWPRRERSVTFALPGHCQTEYEGQKVYGTVWGRCKESYPSEDAEWTRYLHLVRHRSRDRDEKGKGFWGTFCWFMMDTSPQIPNKVDVYLGFVIVVDVSSQSNFQTRVLICGTAIHTWNEI